MISYRFLGLLTVIGLACGQSVETEYGTVVGKTVVVDLASGRVPVHSFWGIPYAEPPVGNRRFEPPVKHSGWTEDFIAHDLPAMCMQNPVGLMFMTHPFWTNYSENCLTLNIVKPETVVGLAPVLVWFHGGGYTGGGSIQYPGHFMAARDTVVVTVNYRLGVFGFSNTPGGLIKGNMGMLDQVMALEFVRDNIENFGGNPNRVTIFGQSAGASSAALHLLSPLSRGLAHQAILESGSDNNVWTLNYPNQSPENYIYQVADNAGCPTNNEAAMVECLKNLDARDLRRFDDITCTPGYFCQGFAPIVDGADGFMPDLPINLRRELGSDSVPQISGICKDDGSLYTIYFIPEAEQGDGFTREEYQFYLRTRLVDIFYDAFLSDVDYENAYEALDWYYTNWPYIDNLEDNRQAFNKLITDGAFGYAWDRNAKLNDAAGAPTYTYIQAFKSLNSTSFIPEWMGVPHNGELAYVWAYSYLLDNPAVRNDTDIHFDILGWTREDMPYSDYVQTLWSNFARYGRPTPTPVPAPFNDTETSWPAFSANDNLKVMYLDGEISVKENYRQQQYYFYTEYLSYISKHPVKRDVTSKKSQGRTKFQLKSSMFQDAITKLSYKIVSERFPERGFTSLQQFKDHFNA